MTSHTTCVIGSMYIAGLYGSNPVDVGDTSKKRVIDGIVLFFWVSFSRSHKPSGMAKQSYTRRV